MTKEEYTAWELKWQELYHKRRELRKELETVNKVMQEIEEDIFNKKENVQ